MDNFEDDELVSAARLGLDMQQFARSPGGMALIERAMRDLNDGLEALLQQADPASPLAREAHAQARAAAGTITYLKECIHDGEKAITQMNEEDGHE